MIIAVGLLVQHHLALYGNYVFVGLLLVACIVMGKSLSFETINKLARYFSFCTSAIEKSQN